MGVRDLLTEDEQGKVIGLTLDGTDVPMQKGDYAQAIVFEDGDGAHEVPFEKRGEEYVGRYGGIRFVQKRTLSDGRLTVEITMETGDTLPEYKYVDLRSGVDSYMVRYPAWEQQFFPTFMRCEKTHFWGYFSRIDGKKLAVACDGKLSSWRNHYNRVYYDPENPDDPGHRVYTTSFCLFCSLKQPQRHPQPRLEKRSVYHFRFVFGTCDSSEELDAFYASVLGVFPTRAKKRTIEKGERILFERQAGEYVLSDEKGNEVDPARPIEVGGRYYLTHILGERRSESVFFVREEPIVYLRAGALAAMKREQFASTNCETYYGFSAVFAYLCEQRDEELLFKAQEKLEVFLHTVLTEEGDLQKAADPARIQNYTTVVSILTLAYRASGQTRYLGIAEKLARKFMLSQGADGAYYSRGVHYTCVIYPAKSLFELCAALKEAGRAYEDIFSSAMRACENLRVLKTAIGTEGEHTFEDGMISCESLQLALAGLLSGGEERERYAEAAKEVLAQHRCLELEYAPDARYRGATLRHWEAHYDVLCSRNMMTSPHGWTSWKTYAQYYLYELTNDPEYLVACFDTLGACLQCTDVERAEVNWAFVVDPCVEANLFVPDREGGRLEKRVLGEEYLPCISPWWRADPSIVSVGYGDPRFGKTDGRARGACCDNDVFEHFKCLQEVGMRAVAHETPTGWITYNCRAAKDGFIVADDHVREIRLYSLQERKTTVNGREYALKRGVNRFGVNEKEKKE